MRLPVSPRRVRRAASFALLLAAAPLVAQRSVADDCFNARQEEHKKHNDILAELRKREIDVDAAYRKALGKCAGDNQCRVAATRQREQDMQPIRDARIDEKARDEKALIDIGRTRCVSNATRPVRQSGTAGADSGTAADAILTDGDRSRLFKLSATMDDVAEQLDSDSGNPALEFGKGLADWASGTLKFLAQKPGVPLNQLAKSIADYLTNDNAANHRRLRAAAQQAVREFQKNPARFIGQNLPNVVPGPGVLGKAPALRQIAQVEKAAGNLEKLAAAEAKFGQAYARALEDGAAVGAGAASPCFAANACFPTALAQAELFRSGEPFVVGGVNAAAGADLRHTLDQIRARLKPYGERYTPRRSSTFDADQLRAIADGDPIGMRDAGAIRDVLRSEGSGSHGLVLVEFERLETHPPDAVLGHVLNVRNNAGVIEFIDNTVRGMDPSFYFPQVKNFLYFPIQ